MHNPSPCTPPEPSLQPVRPWQIVGSSRVAERDDTHTTAAQMHCILGSGSCVCVCVCVCTQKIQVCRSACACVCVCVCVCAAHIYTTLPFRFLGNVDGFENAAKSLLQLNLKYHGAKIMRRQCNSSRLNHTITNIPEVVAIQLF